jgi:two-component system response regulator HydG
MELQPKLLRVLQQHEVTPVGSSMPVRLDVQVVAATNRDLELEVVEGRFREDLYYRLNVFSIETPPLRVRPTDIPLLALSFLHKYAEENGKKIDRFSDEALAQLLHYRWPGNVRELENAIERAIVVCRHDEIRPQDLAAHIVKTEGRGADGVPQIPGATLAELERFAILKTLEYTGGSTSRAADMLAISARTIQYRLREYAGDTPNDPKR